MKLQIICYLGVVLLLLSIQSYSQSVGIGTETPNNNAILELVAPNNDQGLLVPRMTTSQRTATTFTDNLTDTDNGLMVYDTDENKFFFWMSDQWVELANGNLSGLPDQLNQSGKFLSTDGTTTTWNDLDFSLITNIPAGLADGDDNTQLTDADIQALGYLKDATDADADTTNELQNLNLSANLLSISGSTSTIDLSSYLDNSDNQDLSFSSGVIALSGDPDATNIDLSNYDSDATDDFDGVFSSLTSIPTGLSDGDDVNDADADATNEIQDISTDGTAGNISISDGSDLTLNVNDADSDASNEFQDLELSGNSLSLTNSTVSVDLTPFAGTNTDNQTISISGTDLSISGGNTLDVSSLTDDADADPNNEDQTVSAGTGISVNQTGDDFEVTNTAPDQTVSLSNGGNVTISGTYPNFTLSVPTNNDNDDTNEDQTVSAGTGISVSQTADDFEVTNTAPDQTVSLSNGGNVTISGTYPNFTLSVPTNNDNDDTNEDQTVSAGTGISVSQTADDFEVTNTAPDQTVSLSNGGNVTISGTYPNFTLSVPTNNDNDDTNEDQTVSAGTGISVSQTGDDFEVTNTTPDQTVSLSNGGNVTISGTYPNFTLSVPTNNDNSATNEIELPTQTGQSGNFLTTNGSSPSWSSIEETQWSTSGSTINYAVGNVGINQVSPSARLDVVGTTELNGTTTVNDQISADDFVYTSGNEKSYVYSLSGADFTTGESSLSFPSDFNEFYEVRYTGAFYSEFLLRGGSAAAGTMGSMVAPIHLPDGVTITAVEVYGRNSSSTNAMTISLVSASFSTGSSTTAIGTIPASTGSVGLQVNNTGLSISVDNSSLKYIIRIDAQIGALGITGVKIHYTKSTLD